MLDCMGRSFTDVSAGPPLKATCDLVPCRRKRKSSEMMSGGSAFPSTFSCLARSKSSPVILSNQEVICLPHMKGKSPAFKDDSSTQSRLCPYWLLPAVFVMAVSSCVVDVGAGVGIVFISHVILSCNLQLLSQS